MWRIMVGLTAWTAGTAIAVSVAWFGADVVLRNAGAGPDMPVINSSILPSATASASAATLPAAVKPTLRAAKTPPRQTTAPPSASAAVAPPSATAAVRPPSAGASASPLAGDVHAYALTGGNVTLAFSGDSAQLVTAVPAAGYSVQTWSGTGWLRVDFSSGPLVSSLIASWYLHPPTVTVEN
jgi:hypothetical protein